MAIIFQAPGAIDVTTVRDPIDYRIGFYIYGIIAKSSYGRPYVQAVAADPLHEFTLIWNAFNDAWVAEIEEAFRLLCSGQVEFTDSLGAEWLVCRHPGQEKVTFNSVKHGVDSTRWYWTTELRMVESP